MDLHIECPSCRGRSFVHTRHPRRDEAVLCSGCGRLWGYGVLEDHAASIVRAQLANSFPALGLAFGEAIAANDPA